MCVPYFLCDWNTMLVNPIYIYKQKEPSGVLDSFVGATGLEPATAWSQTRNATNCATPRLCKLS